MVPILLPIVIVVIIRVIVSTYDHNTGDRRGGLAEEHDLPALCQDQQTDPVVLDLCQGGT